MDLGEPASLSGSEGGGSAQPILPTPIVKSHAQRRGAARQKTFAAERQTMALTLELPRVFLNPFMLPALGS